MRNQAGSRDSIATFRFAAGDGTEESSEQERCRTDLLLKIQDGHLELALDLRVLDLHTLETIDPPSHRGRQARNVAGWSADQVAELGLRQSEKGGVLPNKCGISYDPSLFTVPTFPHFHKPLQLLPPPASLMQYMLLGRSIYSAGIAPKFGR